MAPNPAADFAGTSGTKRPELATLAEKRILTLRSFFSLPVFRLCDLPQTLVTELRRVRVTGRSGCYPFILDLGIAQCIVKKFFAVSYDPRNELSPPRLIRFLSNR